MRIAAVVIAFFLPSIGLACSCAWPEEISERYVLDQLCASDAVFVGEVESVLVVSDPIFEYKIWPRESFVGRVNSPAYALSDTGGSCGYEFGLQGRYLIFAKHNGNTQYLSASICGLTRPLVQESAVYKILSANKHQMDKVCSKEAKAARRLDRLREPNRRRERLEKATREHLNSNE